ncbi:MAG: fructose-bisphosphate aldolase class I [Deltaproteobacteria bacterium]|nr:fructose-bisphosphate aldolase class I [Deltaproteobacteria bacterium]
MAKVPGLAEMARSIVADGKGILAADETPKTITKRLVARGITSTPETRREHRELLFTAPGITDFIGGVITQDETIHQKSATGVPLAEVISRRGLVPGIKVDKGVVSLAGAPGERVTEGLDGLRERLEEYFQLGARFAKWRAVFRITEKLPSRACVHANAHALARYAALCQEQGLVPIVEPEVLMDGAHGIERCDEVTGDVLGEVFKELIGQHVMLEGMLLKPNMVIPGQDNPKKAPVAVVARATLRTLQRCVPAAVPGVVFLSGGQSPVEATEHLNAINALDGPKPWKLSFSFGRALQDEALDAWKGRAQNVPAVQLAFLERARCVAAAAQGKYRSEMERDIAKAQPAADIH